MNIKKTILKQPGVRGYFLIFFITWTCCVAASLAWNIVHQRRAILSLARMRAELTLKKDIIYRKWVSSKGGVYVPVSTTVPNPYLKVPNRDILTVEGHYLTLMNPAYMTRQVNDMAKEAGFDFGHITSLKPIRPENFPDEWEKKALKDFNNGKKEVSGMDSISGRDYFRLMRPFVVDSNCLKCHAVQGYKIGDIRGGISSAIFMRPLYVIERRMRVQLLLAHGVIWILGIAGIAIGSNRLSSKIEQARSSENSAKQEREKAESYLNIAAEIILALDADGKITLLNDSGYRLLGYEVGELIGKNWFETILPEKEWQAVLEYFNKLKQGVNDEMTHEGPVMVKDGTERHIIWRNAVLRDDAGGFIGTLSSGEDITERKRVENEEAKTFLWQRGVSRLLESLLSPAPLEAKLASITDGIVSLFDADFSRIWMIRPGDLCERECVHAEVSEGPHVCRFRDRCLHLVASSGRYTHMDGSVHRRVPFGCYKIGRIASGEEHRFLTNDVKHDPRVHNHDWARELGLVSFAGYKIHVPGGETMGVLALFAKHQILPIEDVFLDSIGSVVGSVIRQALAEEALKESEERYAMILGAVNDGFWDWEVPTGDAFFSPIYYALLGYDDGEFPASYAAWRSLVHPDDIDRGERDLLQSIETGSGFAIDLRMKMKSGEWRWVSTRGKTVEWDEKKSARRMVGTLTDITGRKDAEEHIQMLLSEKNLLLKEVHHRIKNNMTMIANLLSLQAARLSEPGGVKALKESSNRVNSMTMMYDMLYQTQDFRYVNVRDYIGQIISGITKSLPAISGVTMEMQVEDFVMDSKILFPIGIVINELVTNAYKYAFPDGRTGAITISMSQLPEHHVEISVRDNGVGIPESFDINGQSGFGMKLVNLLVKQIEGTVECASGEGAEFRISFQYDDSHPDTPEG